MKRGKIKALIIDDEKHARENLRILLMEYCQEIIIAGEAENVISGQKMIDSKNPDLVFLDIKLSNETGFKLLELVKEKEFGVIFVTAYDQYAIRAIKFSAIDYILKPLNADDILNAVQKFIHRSSFERKISQLEVLMENLSKDRNFNRIGLHQDGKIEYIVVRKILRLQAESNYTRIFFENNRSIIVAKTLLELDDLLSELGFVRVHKTHLINLLHLKTVRKNKDWLITLSDGSKVPVSRRRRSELSEKIKNNH